MISKTFCVIPWVHVAINTRGMFRLCCNQTFLEQDYEDGDYLTSCAAYDTPIGQHWNSSSYKNIRKKMLNGEDVAPCRRCYREEDVGIQSARQCNNALYFSSLGELDPNGSCTMDTIKYIDVRLGNKCNLKCRMCNPFSSNQWLSDEKKTGLRELSSEQIKQLDKLDQDAWFDREYFWDNLFSVMENCELVYFSGGEPALFSKEHSELFQRCVDNDIAKNITLRYNTNMTIPLDSISEHWDKFKGVRINCSLDGFDKVNDYIRYPSKWKNVEKNFLSVVEMSKDPTKNITMNVMTTVQMYNIFGLIDLFEYLKPYKLFPLLNILNQPGHYNIRVLDKDKKKIVGDELTSWYEKNMAWLVSIHGLTQFHEKLPVMIEYLYKEDWSHLYPDFLHETKVLDELRNQKLENYIPELIL